jgi:hypothetical protein
MLQLHQGLQSEVSGWHLRGENFALARQQLLQRCGRALMLFNHGKTRNGATTAFLRAQVATVSF